MSSRRTLILIAAIAIGGLAAFALFNYVGGIEDRANENAERVDVFVVRRDIPKGLPGEQAQADGFIELDQIPREFRPANALPSLEQIQGQVALSNLSANQVVVAGMFVDPAEAQITFGERLNEDEVAITISVDQVRGVAGLLVPGDEVNMLVTVAAEGETQGTGEGTDPAAPPAPEDENAFTSPYTTPARYLYQSVRILAIGQTAVPEPGETVDPTNAQSGLLTLAVPPDAAQRIASVDPGSIYLSLTPPDYAPIPLPPFDVDETLPGEDGAVLTPYGPEGRQ